MSVLLTVMFVKSSLLSGLIITNMFAMKPESGFLQQQKITKGNLCFITETIDGTT